MLSNTPVPACLVRRATDCLQTPPVRVCPPSPDCKGTLLVENGSLIPCVRRLARLTLGAAVLFALGCGGSSRKAVHPVRGRVLVDGQPAAEALVTFHPVRAGKDQPRAVGNVDAQGNF